MYGKELLSSALSVVIGIQEGRMHTLLEEAKH